MKTVKTRKEKDKTVNAGLENIRVGEITTDQN